MSFRWCTRIHLSPQAFTVGLLQLYIMLLNWYFYVIALRIKLIFCMHRQSISVNVAKKFVMFYLIHTESVKARVIHRKYFTAWTLMSLKTAVSSIYDGAHTAYLSRQYIHVSVS